jgi:mRNA-degrading endonuclease RelE of RelBE toxin-antitoxin system
MMAVILTEGAESDFLSLGTVIKARVRGAFERLEKWPNVSGVKHLKYDLAGYSRVRTGGYRIVFRVENENVIVTKIDDRKDVYKKR